MRLRAAAQRWTSLLLLIAFLHGVLAPAVGLAVGKHESVRTMLVPLCGADGHQLVEIELPDSGAAADGEPAAGHAGFCLLCVYSATASQIGIAAFLPAVSSSVPVCPPGDSEPYCSLLWNPSLARAPPADA